MNSIVVQNVGKRFRRQQGQARTLKDFILRPGSNAAGPKTFWGLRNISLNITAGKTVGVIGQNGAGKSTLLRLIGGVGRPDEGSITTSGRIGALLDLGAGFHPDLTGRENAMVNGVISGLTRRETAARIDDIIAFAELEQFIDSPLRTYSSGMQMRLAFAIAAYTNPQVLLVDEVLAVGDLAFQRKCLDRIAEFKNNGCTIVIVSHDMSQVEQFCDEVIWLRGGQVIAHGPTPTVIAQYVDAMSSETKRRTPTSHPVRQLASGQQLEPNTNRFGSLESEITTVRLVDDHGRPVTTLDKGQALRVEINCYASQPIKSPIISVAISRADGTICLDTNTAVAGIITPDLHTSSTLSLQLDRLDLSDGDYFVDVGLYQHEWQYAYDFHWHVYPLTVRAAIRCSGIIDPPQHWEIVTADTYAAPSR